ncbi:MAG: hypothetical protein DMG80_00070 [Acidobacteria bacterium]|jgi:hypothetical protein|nr:MAG: hypothetical protein DMG80_00070 [Acidobacteriota bacterium]
MGVALICAMSTIVGAQAQVGNLYVGICDGSLQNTQQDEVDVYSPTGQFVTAFHGPTQNACLTGMAFDGADHFHIISARFQTQSWNVLEFDNSGHLLSNRGPFNSPVSITHDTQGNIYLGQGTILKIDPAGNVSSFTVAGGAQWIDMAPDQRTIYYSASNGDVKTFDIVSRTQGPDIAVDALARNVRVLPDNSILTQTLGAIRHWVPPCAGCLPYRQGFAYQVPANADSFALDPDGVSFWTINSFYDSRTQLGKGNVYRMNIKTGDLMASFSLQSLTNGRTYSASIGVNGDGMSSTATVTPSLVFPKVFVGTTSNAKKVVISNTGPVQIVVGNLSITGDFAIKKNGCAKGIPPGGFCNIPINFTPTQLGPRSGTLKIFDNAIGSPHSVALSGTGK